MSPAAADPRPGLAGLWFPLRDGRTPADLSPDQIAAACFETPRRFHLDGVFAGFRTEGGVPRPDTLLRCDATLLCSVARGSASDGRPAGGQTQLGIAGPDAIRACLGADCVFLGRCPAPDWSQRERASGLAAQWEAALEARD